MSGAAWPDVAEILPHAGRMRLLERVLEHAPDRTVCAVEVDRSALFRDADGAVPAWVGLEYMAQCAAVHGGLAARARGEAPRAGILLGSRRMRLSTDRFLPGQVLRVTARHLGGETGLVAFECRIEAAEGGEPLVEGRLSFYTFGEAPGPKRAPGVDLDVS